MKCLLCLSLLLINSLCYAAPDQYEPDNEANSQRTLLISGNTQQHNFHQQGDVDTFKFYALKVDKLAYQFTIEPMNPSTQLLVRATDGGKKILFDNNNDIAQQGQVNFNVNVGATGFMDISVKARDKTNFGDEVSYKITIIDPNPRPNKADIYEIDDIADFAQVLPFGAENEQLHNFHKAGDIDWFKISILAQPPAHYLIQVENAGEQADIAIELYNEKLEKIETIDDNPQGLAQTEALEVFERLLPQQDNFYYIKIKNVNTQLDSAIQSGYSIRLSYTAIPAFLGNIAGQVIDATTKLGVPSPVIKSSGSKPAYQVGAENGLFITSHETGTFQFTATAAGYQPTTVNNIVVKSLEITPLEIIMQPLATKRALPHVVLATGILDLPVVTLPNVGSWKAKLVSSPTAPLSFNLTELTALSAIEQTPATPIFDASTEILYLPLTNIEGTGGFKRAMLKLVPNSNPLQFNYIDQSLGR